MYPIPDTATTLGRVDQCGPDGAHPRWRCTWRSNGATGSDSRQVGSRPRRRRSKLSRLGVVDGQVVMAQRGSGDSRRFQDRGFETQLRRFSSSGWRSRRRTPWPRLTVPPRSRQDPPSPSGGSPASGPAREGRPAPAEGRLHPVASPRLRQQPGIHGLRPAGGRPNRAATRRPAVPWCRRWSVSIDASRGPCDAGGTGTSHPLCAPRRLRHGPMSHCRSRFQRRWHWLSRRRPRSAPRRPAVAVSGAAGCPACWAPRRRPSARR